MRTLLKLAGFALIAVLFVLPSHTLGQSSPAFECDDRFGECGTPEMSGGGGGGGGGAILIANTDLGDTYQFADDYDNDGSEDPFDNCIRTRNTDQTDSDGDGVGDACDNCLDTANEDQSDIDGDQEGDACDDDMDGDKVDNGADNCPELPNPAGDDGQQADADDDGQGDACDEDIDGDGQNNVEDPCPMVAGAEGESLDDEACRPDADGDGVPDVDDNCPNIYDPEQQDGDGDGRGDACDADMDQDGVINQLDNCAEDANQEQEDADLDGAGDACDTDGFCYVVFGDQQHCLNPEEMLSVYAPSLLSQTGQRVRLAFFVNRDDQALSYEWSIVEAPGGSDATVVNARGSSDKSVQFEYAYDEDTIASFKADRAGEYKLRITVKTVGADDVTGQIQAEASHVMALVAEGDDVSSGDSGWCSVAMGRDASAAGTLWMLAAAALMLAVRRRRF
jgi:MYXO-CTERM domain-containing protein